MTSFSFFNRGRGNSAPDSMASSFSSNDIPAEADTSPDGTPLSRAERRIHQFEQLLSASVINLEKIRATAWEGIPDQFRPTVWRLFLDYEPVNQALKGPTLEHKRNDYFDCLERVFGESQRHLWTTAQKATQNQILRDLPRSLVPLLRNERVMSLFERVLFVWAVRHPASGYVQGMNDLLAPFFFVFLSKFIKGEDFDDLAKRTDVDCVGEDEFREIEADSFWCFSKLLDGLQDLFTKDQPGLYKMLTQLQETIRKVDQPLADWIQQEEIEYQEFAFRWMNCLLVREFPLALVLRLWDLYISNHSHIAATHVYVCAAMMTTLSSRLRGLPHAEFVINVQQISPSQWKMEDMEMIMAQAYVYEKMFSQQHQSGFKSMSVPALGRRIPAKHKM